MLRFAVLFLAALTALVARSAAADDASKAASWALWPVMPGVYGSIAAGGISQSFTYLDPQTGLNHTINANASTGGYIVSQDFARVGASSWYQYATSKSNGVGSDQTWFAPHPQPFDMNCIDKPCAWDTSIPLQDATTALPALYPPNSTGTLVKGCRYTPPVSNLTAGSIQCANPDGDGTTRALDVSHMEFGRNAGVGFPNGVGNLGGDPTLGCVQLSISGRVTVPVYVHDNDFEYGPGCNSSLGQDHIQSVSGTYTLDVDTWYYGTILPYSQVVINQDQNPVLGIVANTKTTLALPAGGSLPGCLDSTGTATACTGTGQAGNYQFGPTNAGANNITMTPAGGGATYVVTGSISNSVLSVTAAATPIGIGDTFGCTSGGHGGNTCRIVFDGSEGGSPCAGNACTGTLSSDTTGTYSIAMKMALSGTLAPAQPALIEPPSTGAGGVFGDSGGNHSLWIYNNLFNGNSSNHSTAFNGWPGEAGGISVLQSSGIRVIAYNAFINQGQQPINGNNLG